MYSSSDETIAPVVAARSSSSGILPRSGYVSCIKIDGRPILPPLMTEAKRAEMQQYKKLAMVLESRLKSKKMVRASPQGSQSQSQAGEEQVVAATDLISSDVPTEASSESLKTVEETSTAALRPTPDTDKEKVLQPQSGFDQHFVIRKHSIPVEGVHAAAASQEPDERPKDAATNEDENCSGSSSDIFASVGSSTDTFIIKEGVDKDEGGNGGGRSSQCLDDERRSEGECEVLAAENVPPNNSSPSSPGRYEEREDLILSCKRKRPAFYFDEADDDDEEEEDRLSSESDDILSTANTTFESSEPLSSSVNPFIPPSDVTWTRSGNPFLGVGNSANMSLSSRTGTPEQSQSFVEKNQDEQSSFTTPISRVTPSYDVTLSTKIPSSAENTPVKIPVEEDKLGDRVDSSRPEGYDSDKENQDTSKSSQSQSTSSHQKKHIRKLSYTLDQPSDALLASGMRSAGDCIQVQEVQDQENGEFMTKTIQDPPTFLSTIPPSNEYETPMKYQLNAQLLAMPTPTAEELDNRLEALDRHLEQLQVGVELNKKKHLERYMEDVAVSLPGTAAAAVVYQIVSPTKFLSPRVEQQESTTTMTRPPINDFQQEIEEKFNELQIQQEKQLEYLMQVHREQECRLKEDFDRQRELLLGQLRSSARVSILTPSTTSTASKELFQPLPNSNSLPTTPLNLQSDFDSVSLKSHSTNPFITSTSVFHSPSGISVIGRSDCGGGATESSHIPAISSSDPRSTLTTAASMVSTSNTARSNYASDWTTTDFETETKSAMSSTNTANTLTELSTVGLSKLQAKMKALSPKYRRMGEEAKSPLLKGIAFPNPLNRSNAPVRVPPKALEPSMLPKYARVSACVRGYLTRRLLHTDKIQIIIQTIRDTVDFLLRLYEEDPTNPTHLRIKPEDLNLHRMLIQQLNGACNSFHGIFFKLSTVERMAIIATDRQKLKAKAIKEQAQTSSTGGGKSKYRRNVSTATLKAMERRLSIAPAHCSGPGSGGGQQVPKTPTNQQQTSRKLPSTVHGSKFVNPKPLAKPGKLGISPSTKRRRLSQYVFKPPRNMSATIDTGLGKKSCREVTKSGMNTAAATPKFLRPAVPSALVTTDQNGNNCNPRASYSYTAAVHQGASTATNQLHHHNATYKMKGTGFQANPARIETNFSGVESIMMGQDIFTNVTPSAPPAPASTPARSNKQQASESTWRQSNTSTSTSATSRASSSSRFSIGSNHSGFSSSGRTTNAAAASGRGASSRKSVARNVKPWK